VNHELVSLRTPTCYKE